MKNYSEEELNRAFQRILNYYKSRYQIQKEPKAFLLGGQPGAGKSSLENMLNLKDEYISISGDDYRKYHPKYDDFNKIYGKDSSPYTQQWAGEITEKLVKELRAQKYNIILEGTIRTAELPIKEARGFKENNYNVELYIVTVKPEISYLSTIKRYEKMIELDQVPRMTPKEHHDLVVKNICDNLTKIYESNLFDNIKIFNRENDLVYSKLEKSDLDPGKVLQKEFDRDWELDEYKDYKNDCLDILGVMDSRKAKGEEIELIKSNLFEKMEEIV